MSPLAFVTTVFFKAVAHSPSTSNSSHTQCSTNNSCRRQSPPLECLLLLLPPPLPLKLLLVTLGPQRILHTHTGDPHYQLPWQPHETTSITAVSRSIKVAIVTQTPPFQPACPWPSPAVPSVEQPPSPSPPSVFLTPLGAPAPVSGRERGEWG